MLASLLAVGVVVLVLWAAATGPGTVLEGEGRDRVPLSEPTPTSQSAEAGTGEQSRTEREPREVPAWLRAVVRAVLLVLEVALLVALAWVLWRALRWAWQRWDARARPATQAEGLTGEEELLDTEVLAEVLLGGAAGRRARLEEGPARNAVVACWLELAHRLLDALGADPDAVSVLAAAYHRARYSEVPVSAQDRSRALRALDRVHASVREQLR